MTNKIIVFDGECGLCNRFVALVLRFDQQARFLFASSKSKTAQELLAKHQLTKVAENTVILFCGDRYDVNSTAALKICRDLSWPWPLLWALILIPRFLRDGFYAFIARRRRSFFRNQKCLVMTPEFQQRFLE